MDDADDGAPSLSASAKKSKSVKSVVNFDLDDKPKKSKSSIGRLDKRRSGMQSTLEIKTTSSRHLKGKKKAQEVNVIEELIQEDPSATEIEESSSEESSSEEEKEKVHKKKSKKSKGAVSEDALIRKSKKDAKVVKLKVEKEEGPTSEEDLLAEFAKTSKAARPLPPIPDFNTLLEEVMIKESMKPGVKKDTLEKLRAQHEIEIRHKIDAEIQRRADELERKTERERREQIDANLRDDQLLKSNLFIQEVYDFFQESFTQEKALNEWLAFLNCRKLPNPAFCRDMTTYLRMWEESLKAITIPEAVVKTQEVIELIGELEDVIDLSVEEEKIHMPNWVWIRQLFRDQQKLSLDVATYTLMKNVDVNMTRINMSTATYDYIEDNISICVWLLTQNPIPLTNPRRPPRPRIIINFEKLDDFKVTLPYVLDCHHKAVRVMYLKYDHLSDTCQTSKLPPMPPSQKCDLLTTFRKEWRMKLMYKYEHRDRKPPPDPDDPEFANYAPEPEEFGSDDEIPFVPYKALVPTPTEYVSIIEGHKHAKERKALLAEIITDSNFLNLRKFRILGGVFTVHYLHQPPQPTTYATMTSIFTTRLFIPQELEYVDFFAPYQSPDFYISIDLNAFKAPDPEVLEEYYRQQDALDKLIFISLLIPQHVIFLEIPKVYVWMEEEHHWSNKYIHYTSYDAEEKTISFRSQIFGTFGLAISRYNNLPYTWWNIQPYPDTSIEIKLAAQVLYLEFIIKDGLICMSLLEKSPNVYALQNFVGEFMKFHTLKKILKEGGIDIFPDFDSYFYHEASCEKHWPTEEHLYNNMAAIGGYFNFTWSKWNMTTTPREIVFQMREFIPTKKKHPNLCLAHVSPEKSTYLKCTEEDEEFSSEPMEGIKFSADLINLMKNTVSMFIKSQIEAYPKLNVHVLSQFLLSTRLLSFS
ncbi:unnamed protein product [Phyllotreta striolata]|uniref:Axonemal 84 kDa protein n=1 Tax=Phyllotreta striolata TaxID=444603 RepID=A0A9N9XGY7_PHYSR|nr:unnamed protein product [Phyllotreta striolata]